MRRRLRRGGAGAGGCLRADDRAPRGLGRGARQPALRRRRRHAREPGPAAGRHVRDRGAAGPRPGPRRPRRAGTGDARLPGPGPAVRLWGGAGRHALDGAHARRHDGGPRRGHVHRGRVAARRPAAGVAGLVAALCRRRRTAGPQPARAAGGRRRGATWHPPGRADRRAARARADARGRGRGLCPGTGCARADRTGPGRPGRRCRGSAVGAGRRMGRRRGRCPVRPARYLRARPSRPASWGARTAALDGRLRAAR